MEEEGDKRKGEKGKENVGTKEKEEEKAAGKRGNGTGKTGATRLKTRTKKTQKNHKGNGKPKDGDRKDGTAGCRGRRPPQPLPLPFCLL